MNYGYLFTEKVGTHFSWIGEGMKYGDNCKTDQHEVGDTGK